TVCYHLAFPNDRAYIKCLVYAIYLLEFIQSVLVIEHGFQIFVTGFGDIGAIDQVGSTWSVPILTAIATSIVQVFYAHRISVLARSKKLPGVIIAVSGRNICTLSQIHSKNVASCTALLHSTLWRDSGWGQSAAAEICFVAHLVNRSCKPWRIDKFLTSSCPIIY
ncbi:hypothetical protein M413DRAFT_59942, partial [Hebeloma cylindrosporum]